MVKHSMDLLELLRKRGIDGDVDFLREALRVLVDGIMDAEVSVQIGADHGERSPERVTYRNAAAPTSWPTCSPECPSVPNLAWPPGPSRMVRTIYQQLSPAEVHGQLDRVVEQLREPFAQVAELLADAAPDILAFTAFPVAHWQKLWSNNPQERLNREIRRRTDVVGIFPNRQSARRLVGAVLAEQHDEWAEARRYLTIPNAAGNEALPEPNMLEAAA